MKLPPNDNFPEIISGVIVLRQVQVEDIKDLVEISFYDSRQALFVEDAIDMQNKINWDYQKGTSIHWGIAERPINKIIGTVGYYRGFDDGVGELGCILKPEFRGQGFMTTALKIAINFGFEEMGLAKIIAITTKQNEGANKLLKRLNFIQAANQQTDEIEYFRKKQIVILE